MLTVLTISTLRIGEMCSALVALGLSFGYDSG